MKKTILYLAAALTTLLSGCSTPQVQEDYLRVEGEYLMQGEDTFFIRGINLGNWLNPEGYMFAFRNCSSAGRINTAFAEAVGPDFAAKFWRTWRENYITEADIDYIASTGANTIRLPFHYKIFTPDLYLGGRSIDPETSAIAQIDSCVAWCKRNGLKVILDMHDAPAGQTGDNIDDSYGYPWLLVSPESQKLFCDIWQQIAARYKDEPTVLGYELCNEPIAHYFQDDLEQLNAQLEPLFKRAVEAIRTVDKQHIILLGGAQWNGTFAGVFHDWHFDDNIMYTCHRYGQSPDVSGISDLIAWRDSTHLCMYMGETGHNTIEWIRQSVEVYETYNIGYTFWPYKKMGNQSWVGFNAPEGWNEMIDFAEADRSSYFSIRELRPNQQKMQEALTNLLDSCRFEHCFIDSAYISAMHLIP